MPNSSENQYISYDDFLINKAQADKNNGFEPVWVPDFMFGFQKHLAEWAIRKGKGAVFADCGLGKTLIQLVSAENVVRKKNKRVLIITPLAVSAQTVREGEKFGIDCEQSRDGKFKKKIIVTNYEMLHFFDRNDFEMVICDESSAIKNFSGQRPRQITRFMRKIPYRQLGTATASPNDFDELGTSSEALGEMKYLDMIGHFFINQQNTINPRKHWIKTGGPPTKWRFMEHAEIPFWKWVCTWAKTARKPSDLGFDDEGFDLPALTVKEHVIQASRPMPGRLFVEPAVTISEQREERKTTLKERCEKVAEIVDHKDQVIVWCQYNNEGALLSKIIPDAVEIKGGDKDQHKEETFLNFAKGQVRVLVTKPKIGAFGLNFQNCHHMTFFPSHSYEQYYQGVRRCWRFGQDHEVNVDIVTTVGEFRVLRNLQRKAEQADRMFTMLVKMANSSKRVSLVENFKNRMEVPQWI